MTRGKQFSGNKPTRKNASCDRRANFESSLGYLYRPFFKKRGGGKGDWGHPGDEMVEVDMHPLDPMFEDSPDAEIDAALYQHLHPRYETTSPITEEEAAEGDMSPVECPTLDCDMSCAAPTAGTIFGFSSESPKGSWLHSFDELPALKLPHNAVWPLVPDAQEVSTNFFDSD